MPGNFHARVLLYSCIMFGMLSPLPLRSCQELNKLPLPLLWHVARYLPKRDISALRCTCRVMAHSVIDESDYWCVDENGLKVAPLKSHILRRKELIGRIRDMYPESNNSVILLIANYERDADRFIQESSFYYLTGINESAVVMMVEMDGTTTLFVPRFKINRAQWVEDTLSKVCASIQDYGIDRLVYMGESEGYLCDLWTKQEVYNPLIYQLQTVISNGGNLFTVCPDEPEANEHQRLLLQRFSLWINGFGKSAVDISEQVGVMRRRKDSSELQEICKAIEGTAAGIVDAAHVIRHNAVEFELQAAVDNQIAKRGMLPAFSTIAPSGPRATVLHYMSNSHHMGNGQLVMIDCGGQYHYGADLTRTFPVSGKFTARQLYLYNAVLQTQQHVASIVRPGYWMSNAKHPEKSLRHIAQSFLESQGGLKKYFPHGISHYLGLDTHDVGGYEEPLENGAVITIEPGVYIPEEGVGIRIEDDFLITQHGAICLSRDLPRQAAEIEALMASKVSPSK